MGDGISISGGAGSFDARLEDLKSFSRMLDSEGDDLLALAGPIASAGGDALTEAALICPDLVPGVLASIAAAEAGPDGVLTRGAALKTVSTLVTASADGYQAADELGADLLGRAQTGLGMLAGVALPGVALVGGGAAALTLLQDPVLAAQAAAYAKSGKIGPDLQRYLYEHPEASEALTRLAPGLVQGTAFSLSMLATPLVGPMGGPLLLSGLSGGKWPTTDYEDAVTGLNTVMGHAGVLQDTGDFALDPAHAHRVADQPMNNLQDILKSQNGMNDGLGDDTSAQGQVRVVSVVKDGQTSLVVQVPGTEQWDPKRGDNPVDLTTNTQAMAGADTKMKQQVAEAIRMAQKDHPGAPVMLTGHSQGGIVAATLASDPKLVKELNIQSLVTAGSPVGRMHVQPDVSVMSLEHNQDVVPMLDGASNPDRANWVTVRRDLPADAPNAGTLGGAHDLGLNYTETASMVDRSQDPSATAWREHNAAFLGGKASSVTYPIVRK